MSILKSPYWILLLAMAAAVIVYTKGLDGPFLFDDHVHITKNRWVKIDSLSGPELAQAWNSSFSPFPTNRPLAQLTFGINHALAGLSPWAFKATNLAIHLLTGLLVFVLSRLAYRAVAGPAADPRRGLLLGAATAAVWLLHPLHVSTVLYTVQRMAQLSSLGLFAALSCYFWGRIRLSEGRPGIVWMLAALPCAALAFLAKENAALLPLLLLVSEITLLRKLPASGSRTPVLSVWALYIAIPLLAGLAYLASHPGYVDYDGRPFTLEERLLTQFRVLWLYLQWLYIPDVSAYGLFHDDIHLSTGLTTPPSTLIALIGWISLTLAALLLRRRVPVFSFAVLFFLAGHAFESSIFPLEVIFEHRNYLPSFGPLFLLAYLVIVTASRMNAGRLASVLGALLLCSYAATTYVRVGNWSSYERFILAAAEHHPNSPRSNFMAAQVVIAALDKASGNVPELANAARTFLNQGLVADARCINCLFGLVVLDLHLGNQPDPAIVARLGEALRVGNVGPTKVSVSQFGFLVKWLRSGDSALTPSDLESIFDAALANPRWVHTGRAGIEAAYREYHEFVSQDLEAALLHGRAAVDAWPEQWSYHMQLVRVLKKLGRIDQASEVLDEAARLASNESQHRQTAELRDTLAAHRES
jgi:hypothetical protein